MSIGGNRNDIGNNIDTSNVFVPRYSPYRNDFSCNILDLSENIHFRLLDVSNGQKIMNIDNSTCSIGIGWDLSMVDKSSINIRVRYLK